MCCDHSAMVYYQTHWTLLFIWSLTPQEVQGYTLLGTSDNNLTLNFATFQFSTGKVTTFQFVSLYGFDDGTDPAFLNAIDG